MACLPPCLTIEDDVPGDRRPIDQHQQILRTLAPPQLRRPAPRQRRAPLAVREEASRATLALGWTGASFARDALTAWASDTAWVVGDDVPSGLQGRLLAVVPGDPARALAKGGHRVSETT